MVAARLIHSDIKKDDMASPSFIQAGGKVGAHRLKDWGIRLGELKADYGGGWEEYTPEMLAYMMQDVKTNVRLLRHLKVHEYPQAPLELEHRVAAICDRITEEGWPFDIRKAGALHAMLCEKRDVLERSLVDHYGSWQEIDRQFEAKVNNKTLGYVKGQMVTKWKTVVFNPGSRVHIEKKLREAGWEPEEFTEKGRAKLNDEVLEKINLPQAQELIDYLLIQKRIGTIADGDAAWLRVVQPDGCIHGSYNPMGTPHGRASHFSPNIAQVPNAHSLYGNECRELFTVPKSWKLVGADQAGCQLRVLGHYIAAFDGGKYGKIVSEGDIHTYHQEAASPHIKSRNDAKTTIYALIFGAAAAKLGAINGGDALVGAEIMDNLKEKIPGFGKLLGAVEAASAKGWLKGLDGRSVPLRKRTKQVWKNGSHYATVSWPSALNYLIASGEAILCKRWLADAYDELCRTYKWGWENDFVIVGWIHDEIQVACREEIADQVAEIMRSNAENAGNPYGFKVKLKSDSKIGSNWRETH